MSVSPTLKLSAMTDMQRSWFPSPRAIDAWGEAAGRNRARAGGNSDDHMRQLPWCLVPHTDLWSIKMR